MMKSNRKHEMPVKRLIIVAVFLSILGLVIIHIAYKLCGPEWLVSEWSAGDALSYYGALIASVITIYGLYLTFMDNRKGISEQSRLDKLPFIGIIMLNQNHRIPLFEFEDPTAIQLESRAFKGTHEGYYYTETRPDTFFCVIENGKTVVKRALPKEKLSLIRFHGIEIVHVASGISLTTHHNLLYIPLEVTNVGNGAAIDLHFGFNKLDNGIKLPNATHLPSRSRSIQICILQSMLIMIKMRIVDSILWSIITRIFSVIIMSRNRFSSWE